MKKSNPLYSALVGLLITEQALAPLVAYSQDGIRGLFDAARNVKRLTFENERPPMGTDPCVEQIAGEIDWLEHLIETHGTGVAKHPDVWGEARLTRYRADYEREIEKKFCSGDFTQGLQASLRRSDSAFLALAFALNDADKAGGTATNQAANLIQLPGNNESAKPSPFSSNLIPHEKSAFSEADKLGLEPIIQVEQLSNYLNHINQLRRRNEGDDTADSPGYALNLLRIPVSLLPGKHTREGYGAETTFTLRPIISDDLLPTTMRDLIINDVVEQNALPLAQVFNNDPGKAKQWLEAFESNLGRVSTWLLGYDAWLETVGCDSKRCPDVIPSLNYLEGFREYLAFRFLQIAQAGRAGSSHAPLKLPLEDGSSIVLPWVAVASLLDDLFPAERDHEQCPARYGYPIASSRGPAGSAGHDFLVQLMDAEQLSERRMDLAPYGPVTIAPSSDQLRWSILTAFPTKLSALIAEARAIDPKIEAVTVCDVQDVCKKILASPDFQGIHVGVDDLDGCPLHVSWPQKQEVLKAVVEEKIRETAFKQAVEKVQPRGVSDWMALIASGFSSGMASSFDYQNEISRGLDRLNGLSGTAAFANFIFNRAGESLTPAGAKRERAMSPAQYPIVYGTIAFHRIALETYSNLRKNPTNHCYVHLLDIRQVLRAEAEAAYRLLDPQSGVTGVAPAHPGFWRYASPELAHAIRHQDFATIRQIREGFFREFNGYTRHMITGALAWGILVEASLLNERLNEDMQSLAKAKGSMAPLHMAMSFIGPREFLTPEAQEAFKAYVAARWPPIVFALDPSKTEQNVADTFASRRELQLAVSIAVAKGEMNASAAGRFMRELEFEMETVALNPTQVAFSHGNDTFGWRFYPRLQTPDTPGSVRAFGETLFGVGPTRKDCLLRQQRLEPGLRECSAVVIMPSFVPYATVECRTNWFALTNPEKKVLTLHDSMRISRAYQSIQQVVHCPADHGLYRPQDVAFLGTALSQLEKRMPLQSMTVAIPYENTLGGFDMFATGVTGLGPQLDGWYGAPGIDLKASVDPADATLPTAPNATAKAKSKKEEPAEPPCEATANAQKQCTGSGTTLFLVGDHFSPLESKMRVIAGGRCCQFQLLSRQVLEVIVPSDAMPLNVGKGEPQVVDIHVATPYGPTNHLLIPVARQPEIPVENECEAAGALKNADEAKMKWTSTDVTCSVSCDKGCPTICLLCESAGIGITPVGRSAACAPDVSGLFELRAGKPALSSNATTTRRGIRWDERGVFPLADVLPELLGELIEKVENEPSRCSEESRTLEVEGTFYPSNGAPPVKVAVPLRVILNPSATHDSACSEGEAKMDDKTRVKSQTPCVSEPLPAPQNSGNSGSLRLTPSS